jgi:predicted AAA+ superfamily ATPase
MVKRVLQSAIHRFWTRGKSILLLGPRQTGKTTIVSAFDVDLTINFLSNRIRQEYEVNPDLILREIAGLKLKRLAKVVVDEVQKVPEIMDPIQKLIDEKKAQFIITGSSARKLKMQSDLNLLPGRVLYFRLDSFSLEEYKFDEILRLLYFGSLPEIALTEDADLCEELLRSYVEIYLEEEIRKEAQLRKIPDFFRFLEFAAQKSGDVVSYSKIAQEVGLSHVTVKSYYEILETTLIADRVEPITFNKTRKKLIRSPRYLFFDLGVRRLAAREGLHQAKVREGMFFEQFIGMEISKFLRSNRLHSSLHFWQDPGVADVDWVIQKGDKYIPIEVKFTNKIKTPDLRHLKNFMKEYDCPKGAIVFYTGRNRLSFDENILAVPWQELPEIIRELKIN